MGKTNYPLFLLEAIKVTLFCLIIVGIFYLCGASQKIIITTFVMSVMSCAATFSPEKKHTLDVFWGSVVIVVSILGGGLLAFYIPVIAKALVVVYGVLAFWLPKKRFYTVVFITGAVIYQIYSFHPMGLKTVIEYLPYSIALIILFALFYRFCDSAIYPKGAKRSDPHSENRGLNAITVGIALIGAYIAESLLHHYTSLSHLYWIGLTTLVIMQSAQGKAIKTSLLRICVNIVGALVVVALMNYIIPANFWLNFILLAVFLFCIFALGFSFILRTLFIEMFVLSFSHLLENFHDIVAVDRIILTLTGGALVIIATLVTRAAIKYQK